MTNQEINALYAQAKTQQEKSDRIIGAISFVLGLVMTACTVMAFWSVLSH